MAQLKTLLSPFRWIQANMSLGVVMGAAKSLQQATCKALPVAKEALSSLADPRRAYQELRDRAFTASATLVKEQLHVQIVDALQKGLGSEYLSSFEIYIKKSLDKMLPELIAGVKERDFSKVLTSLTQSLSHFQSVTGRSITQVLSRMSLPHLDKLIDEKLDPASARCAKIYLGEHLAPVATTLVSDSVLIKLTHALAENALPEILKVVTSWVTRQKTEALTSKVIHSLQNQDFTWAIDEIKTQVMQHDFSSVIDGFVGELKGLYHDHLMKPLPNGSGVDIKQRDAAQGLVYQVIDNVLAEVNNASSLTAQLALLSDTTRIKAIFKQKLVKSLQEAHILAEEGLSPQKFSSFMRAATGNLHPTLSTLIDAANPKNSMTKSGFAKLALHVAQENIGSFHGLDFTQITPEDMEYFVDHGLCDTLDGVIFHLGGSRTKQWLTNFGLNLNLHISQTDLDWLIDTERNCLTEESRNYFKTIEAKSAGKPAIDQLMSAVFALMSKMGYMHEDSIDPMVSKVKDGAICMASAALTDTVAARTLAGFCEVEVLEVTPMGQTTYLPTYLANAMELSYKPVMSAEKEIKASLDEALPWFMFQGLCGLIGHKELASEANYLSYIAPHIDFNASIRHQVSQLAGILKHKILPEHGVEGLGVMMKLAAAKRLVGSLDLGINLVLRQVKRSLMFASYSLSDTAMLSSCMHIINVLFEGIKQSVLTLESEGIEPGSTEWKESMAAAVAEQQRLLFETVMEIANTQVRTLPKSKLEIFKAILKDESLTQANKIKLAVEAFFALIFSPILTMVMMIGLWFSGRIPMEKHPLYNILSTVFEMLDIEDNNNLLSSIIDQTNQVLDVKVESLAIDNAGPAKEWAPQPQLDQFLLDFASTILDKSSEVDHSISFAALLRDYIPGLRDSAKMVREIIQGNLQPEDIRSYLASSLATFIPAAPSDVKPPSYREHVATLAQKSVEATAATLKGALRQSSYCVASDVFQLIELFHTEGSRIACELTEISCDLNAPSDTAHELTLMKKAFFKGVYFIQEVEKSYHHLAAVTSQEAATFKVVIEGLREEITLLGESFDRVKQAKSRREKLTASIAFKNHLNGIKDLILNDEARRSLTAMWDAREETFTSWDRHHRVLPHVENVLEGVMPESVKKYVHSLSGLVSHLSAKADTDGASDDESSDNRSL